MTGISAITKDNGGGDGYAKGQAAAVRADMARPYYQAYADDQFFYQPIAIQGTIHPTLTRALTESYYKYLPPLTRGHVVPNGYPLIEAGFDLSPNFFPRILWLDFRQDTDQEVKWTYPHVAGTAWSETLAAAFPNLKKAPTTGSSTLAKLLAHKATVVVQKDSKGKHCGWFNQQFGIYFSFKPHVLFDNRLRAKRIFADPTAQFWQSTYSAWLQPSWRESLRDFCEKVIIAYCAAYAIGAAGVNGSAGATSTTASSGLEATTVETAAPTIETAPTLEATAITTGAPLETLGASDIGTLAATVGAAGSVAGDVAAGTSLLDAGSKALDAVKKVAAAVLPKSGAKATNTKTATAKTADTSAGFDPKWYVAGGVSLVLVLAALSN